MKTKTCALCVAWKRRCVNPDYLFLGTNAENSADMVKKNARGEQNGRRKLTEVDVLRIRRGYYADMAPKEIAKKLGVSCMTIYLVLRGVTWKHLSP